MYEENIRSLKRYDINTLQPIPRVKLMPRAQLSRDNYGISSSRPISRIEYTIDNQDNFSDKDVKLSSIPAEGTKLGKMISIDYILNGRKKVYEGNIGSGRFFFLFQKYPALVGIIISLLLNYGQRYNDTVKYLIEERVQIIMSLANGLNILVSSLHGIQNHNYSFTRVKILSIIKVPHLIITLIAAIIQLVYSVLSYVKLNNNQNDLTWLTQYGQCDINIKNLTQSSSPTINNTNCYTVHDRIICSCIFMGCAISIIILGLFSIASFFTAYINHKMDVKTLKEKQVKQSKVISAYTNQTAFESTM
ncbi:Hypothetical protein SRAE_X000138600 [Strongyloides ratti]|uniref:Uncharacterized protein n=1 Tax=Strongyloides ratti TaxID=34506 RepID=A0A090KUV0_STRRB|nr:Hypothetical protein SRAE_X000138600 [Strongyloides ratti]CEF59640.1 Hypothetical protein SRAE_X000138600 [Strongyloides ratti]